MLLMSTLNLILIVVGVVVLVAAILMKKMKG
jgi:hypothetical protein